MDGGVIGKLDGEINNIESFQDTRDVGDFELKRALDVRRTIAGPGGQPAYEGQAAIERVKTTDTFEFSGDRIISSERETKTPFFTNFVLVPNSFVVVESGAGTFVFDLIFYHTGIELERASIDLNGYYQENGNANPWKVGFYGRPGNAENGVVYGDEVMSDEELGQILAQTNLNQLGLEDLGYQDFSVKMTASESGYVEVYQPSNFESEDFVQYVADHIIPHVE